MSVSSIKRIIEGCSIFAVTFDSARRRLTHSRFQRGWRSFTITASRLCIVVNARNGRGTRRRRRELREMEDCEGTAFRFASGTHSSGRSNLFGHQESLDLKTAIRFQLIREPDGCRSSGGRSRIAGRDHCRTPALCFEGHSGRSPVLEIRAGDAPAFLIQVISVVADFALRGFAAKS